MDFKNTDKWSEELLELFKAAVEDGDGDDERIYELIDQAEGYADVKAVQTLIKCLSMDNGSFDTTIFSALSTIDYPIYYAGMFEVITSYFDIEHETYENSEFVSLLLDWQMRDLTKKELEDEIFPIAKKYLSLSDIQKYIKILEGLGYPEEDNDEPFVSFYHFFKETVIESKK